jgi:hypothetical protein
MLIVAVLMVVLLWWALVFPHTTRYQRAKNESLVKERLMRIQPPPGAKLLDLSTSHRQSWPEALADYSIDSACPSVKAYYREEFARQGFSFEKEYKSLESSPEADSLSYSDHDYSVGLSCDSSEKQASSYMIILIFDSRVDKEIPLPNPMDGARR